MAINQFEKILIDTIELPVEPEQPLEIIVEDVVAGKNVHVPIANYNDPGIASFSNEDFIVSADGRVEAVSHNPNSLFIRYSAYADGSNFTETWTQSQMYIGFAVGKSAPLTKDGYTWFKFIGRDAGLLFIRYSEFADGTDFTETWSGTQIYVGLATANSEPMVKEDYTWSRFVGNTIAIESLDDTGAITHLLADRTDTTFADDAITSIEISFPEIYHGFYAGVNFRTMSAIRTVVTFGLSSLPLKKIFRSVTLEEYIPSFNAMVDLCFFSDGVYLYCYIKEVL